MIPFYIAMAFYIIALIGFIVLSWFNVRQDRMIEDWNQSTEHEIKVIRERNLELELKVKELIEFKKAFDPIEPEPDVKFAPRKEEL